MRRFVVMAFMAAAMVAAVGFGTGSASAQSAPPVANPGGPYVGVVGQPITISGAASTGTNLSFSWAFCDGTAAVGAVITKSFGTVGACSLTLTVTNSAGQSSTASTTANIGGFAGGFYYPYGVYGGAFPGVISNVIPNGCVLTAGGYVCGSGAIVSGCFVGVTGTVCTGTVGAVGFATCGVHGVVYNAANCPAFFNGFFNTVGTGSFVNCQDIRFGAPQRCVIHNP